MRRSKSNSRVTFCYDESLPKRIGEALRDVGFDLVFAPNGMKDEVLIPWMADQGYAWLTKDDRAKVDHEPAIRSHGISVVWVRGLAQSKNKKASLSKKAITLKDFLRMMVDKLDYIAEELGKANGPRFFIVYTTHSNKTSADRYTTLKDVGARLAGLTR